MNPFKIIGDSLIELLKQKPITELGARIIVFLLAKDEWKPGGAPKFYTHKSGIQVQKKEYYFHGGDWNISVPAGDIDHGCRTDITPLLNRDFATHCPQNRPAQRGGHGDRRPHQA